MYDIEMGRIMLRDVRETIKKNKRKYPKDFTKGAWTYKHADNSWECQLPKVKYQWYGHADSAYEAKACAFEEYMNTIDKNGV